MPMQIGDNAIINMSADTHKYIKKVSPRLRMQSNFGKNGY